MANSESNVNRKSLIKSLSTISNLATKGIDIAMVKIAFFHNAELTFVDNEQAARYHFDIEEEIIKGSLNKKEVFISEKFPSTDTEKEINCYASIPLISTTGNNAGSLIVFDTKPYSFTDQDIILLKNFAQLTSDIIEKHIENEKIQRVFADFLHKTVHDLKNPLTSISLTSELLKRKAEDPKTVISFSERLEKASQKLFASLENLKSAYPIENSGFKLNVTEISLGDFLADIQKSISTADIKIENTITTAIYAEYDRLKEAITQLVTHILLNGPINNITIKSYPKDDEAVIEIASRQMANFNSTAITIAKTLIGMHKGKLAITLDSYLISLPLTVL